MARRPLLQVFLGTAPGLERFLLAIVPAFVVGALGRWAFGSWVGLALGLATLAIVVLASRGIDR
jgi:hypothetical protein